jgi:hypothetical protein
MDDESIARLPVVDRQASSPPGPAGSFKKRLLVLTVVPLDCSATRVGQTPPTPTPLLRAKPVAETVEFQAAHERGNAD